MGHKLLRPLIKIVKLFGILGPYVCTITLSFHLTFISHEVYSVICTACHTVYVYLRWSTPPRFCIYLFLHTSIDCR